MNDRQRQETINALKGALDIYSLNIRMGLGRLFSKAFKDPAMNQLNKEMIEDLKAFLAGDKDVRFARFEHKDELNDLIQRMDKAAGNEFEIELTDSQIHVFCLALDLYIRIWLGQWEELYSMLRYIDVNGMPLEVTWFPSSEIRDRLYWYREKIVPAFAELSFGAAYGASFGIHSTDLNDSIRVIYDIYKVMMYEKGSGGVYAYTPYPISDEPACSITFPIVREWDGKENLEEFLGKGKYKYHNENGQIYAPIKENIAMLVEKGDTLLQLRNGFYRVVKN